MPHSSAQRTVKEPSCCGRRVGHVVVVRVGVGLDPELVGPEAVDHVERGHVELDGRVVGNDQLVGLEPAEGRVAVGELPLLADDLNGQHGLRRRGPDRARALAAAGAARLDELVGAESGQEQHDDRRDQDPAHLDPEVAPGSRPADRLGPAARGPPHHDGVDHVDPDGEEHGQGDDEQHVEVELRAVGRVGHGARRDVGPGQEVEERVQDGREDHPDRDQPPPVVRLVVAAVRAALRRASCPGPAPRVAHATTFMKPPM